MQIEKKYDKETGKTSWTFNNWTYKLFFGLGCVTFWFYVACFVVGFIQGVWEL